MAEVVAPDALCLTDHPAANERLHQSYEKGFSTNSRPSEGLSMRIRDLFIVGAVVAVLGCAPLGGSGAGGSGASPIPLSPDPHREAEFPEFSPTPEEILYRFTYTFQKANGEEIVRNGRGFVLVHGSSGVSCNTGMIASPGTPASDARARSNREDARGGGAAVAGRKPGAVGNHWTCIRSADGAEDLYLCDYYFPEGAEQVIQSSGSGQFYGPPAGTGTGFWRNSPGSPTPRWPSPTRDQGETHRIPERREHGHLHGLCLSVIALPRVASRYR